MAALCQQPTAGACMAQAECGLAAWPCLVGLGGAWLLCDFVRIDRLGGQIFCAGFFRAEGAHARGWRTGKKAAAWVRTRLHRCQTRLGRPCLRNTDQANGKGQWQTTHSVFPGTWRQIHATNWHLLLACKITQAAPTGATRRPAKTAEEK